MQSKIIPIFNQAGGVSKTTITHNLGFALADRGYRVLEVDLDPQGTLTIFNGIDLSTLKSTIYHSLSSQNAPLPIEKDLYEVQLDLVPADIKLADAEHELLFADQREFRLKEVLDPVRKQYDFILIDCPPSLGLLSLNALVTGTHLLIPVETQYKSYIALDSLFSTIGRVTRKMNKSLLIAAFLPTKHTNTNNNKEFLKLIQEQVGSVAPVLPPFPQATAVASASKERKPIALCSGRAKNQPILDWFDNVVEVLEKL